MEDIREPEITKLLRKIRRRYPKNTTIATKKCTCKYETSKIEMNLIRYLRSRTLAFYYYRKTQEITHYFGKPSRIWKI